jgi:hypothetical protein
MLFFLFYKIYYINFYNLGLNRNLTAADKIFKTALTFETTGFYKNWTMLNRGSRGVAPMLARVVIFFALTIEQNFDIKIDSFFRKKSRVENLNSVRGYDENKNFFFSILSNNIFMDIRKKFFSFLEGLCSNFSFFLFVRKYFFILDILLLFIILILLYYCLKFFC